MPPRRKSNLGRLSKQARAKRIRLKNETDVEAAARRRKQREWQAASRARETPEQTQARLATNAERAAARRAAQKPKKSLARPRLNSLARRIKHVECAAAHRAAETPEEHSLALYLKERERVAYRRFLETPEHTLARCTNVAARQTSGTPKQFLDRCTKVAQRHVSPRVPEASEQLQSLPGLNVERQPKRRWPFSLLWAAFNKASLPYNPLIHHAQEKNQENVIKSEIETTIEMKEAQVLPKRIPKTTMQIYNCWPPGKSKGITEDETELEEETANLGVLKPAHTYSKSPLQPKPNLFVVLSMRHLDAATYFLDVPEVPGADAYLTSISMMAIKICCDESDHDGNDYKLKANCLGLQLTKEGYNSNPVRWLVKKGYIDNKTFCYVCKRTAVLSWNPQFKDGCSWSCQNEECQFENHFRRPNFFALFPNLSMAYILVLIFHWSVQSNSSIILSDVPMSLVKISHVWQVIQKLCRLALQRERCKIGGPNSLVEVGLVQFGESYVLGVYDRSTKLSILKAFPCHQFTSQYFCWILKWWLNPGTIVIVNADKSLNIPPEFYVIFADCNEMDKKSTTYHVLNITSYLLSHVSFMFGHLRADVVQPETMQVFLDELMWRERNGRKPQLAFSKMMHEIFHNHLLEKSCDITEIQEEPEQESLSPIKMKEAQVVLRRIPKTVLKLYNCWPPAPPLVKCEKT